MAIGTRIRQVSADTLRPHSLASLVPPMRKDEWDEFYADVALRGIKVPLEVDGEGVILDGRHRWKAAKQLGIQVPIVDAPLSPGESPAAYMLKAAVLRRHLTDDQRAMIAAKWKEENKKEPVPPPPGPGRGHTEEKAPAPRSADAFTDVSPTRQQATSLFNVPRRKLDNATYIARRAPELAKKVWAGEVGLNQAVRSLKKQPTETPPLPAGVFDVIYADPPWPYQNQIADWGPTSLHYSAMSLDDIKAKKVAAAENAALFLWVTNPMIREALEVVEAWGFNYKTNMVWVKTDLKRPGSGFYVRGRHELLFICTRGSFVPDQTGKEPIGSVIEAPLGDHSSKPEQVYDIIQRMYPGRRYVELFARKPRAGWTAWGNERDGPG